MTKGINTKAHLIQRHPCPLLWRYNGRDGVSNHQPHDCLLNRLFMRRSKKTSKLRVTGLCSGNSPVTGEFPARMASNTENVSILMTSSCLLSLESYGVYCEDFVENWPRNNGMHSWSRHQIEAFLRYWLSARRIHHGWILLTKGNDAELWCFLWCAPEYTT